MKKTGWLLNKLGLQHVSGIIIVKTMAQLKTQVTS